MSYQAMYRVWRPQHFADVVGQTHITQTLQNALKEQTYTHAYLFSGPRGTGKTSTAKIMAQAVNCQQAPAREPCLECEHCQSIAQGAVVDVIEIDAASNNGIDEIRDLRDKVKYAPTEVKKKVYIIDEVHMLTQGAFNALLKTLEEPPQHVLFILATTEPHKIPLTIVSRCQRFDFRRVSRQTMLERMSYICDQEQIVIEEEALQLVVQVAEGGMRDALSLLDQVVSFAGDGVKMEDVLMITGSVHQDVLSELADHLLHGKVEEAIHLLDHLMEEGKEPLRLVEDLIYYYRDILMYRQDPELEDVLERVQVHEAWKEKVGGYAQDHLFQAIERLSRAQQEMKWTHHPRIFMEVAMIELCQTTQKRKAAQDSLTAHRQTVGSTPSAGTALSTDEHQEWETMRHKIDRLEEQLRRLEQDQAQKPAQTPAFPTQGPTASRHMENRSSVNTGLSFSSSKLKEMLKSAQKELLLRLNEEWSHILEEVKSRQIMVHAWLRDGQPVACSADFFLVAFQNEIHRETTEKESHRTLIEEVVGNRLHNQAKLVTIMYNDWQKMKEAFIREQKGFQSGSPTAVAADSEQEDADQIKDLFYEEAVNLVGEDLIEYEEEDS